MAEGELFVFGEGFAAGEGFTDGELFTAGEGLTEGEGFTDGEGLTKGEGLTAGEGFTNVSTVSVISWATGRRPWFPAAYALSPVAEAITTAAAAIAAFFPLFVIA